MLERCGPRLSFTGETEGYEKVAKAKLYIITISIQIAAIAVFGAAALYLLDIERVILSPVPYMAALWLIVTALDAIALLLLFGRQDDAPNKEHD